MYREFARDMTENERETLMARIADPPMPESWKWTLKWGVIWFVAMLLCGVAMATIITLFESHPLIGGPLVGIVGVAGIIFLYCFIMVIGHHRETQGHLRRFLREDVPALRLALDDGKVDVKHVVARAVVQFEEYEDEGTHWLFDVGAGQAFFLPEIWYFESSAPWPNSDFEIVRSKASDRVIGVFCRGTKLQPKRVIGRDECRDEVLLESRERFVEGDIDRVAESMLKPENE